MDSNKKIDYSKLNPELRAKLEDWEKNKPEHQQLLALQEVVSELSALSKLLDSDVKQDAKASNEMKALLGRINKGLESLNARENPELPDFSQPIVEALGKLEDAMAASVKSISVTPEFKPNIQVDSPSVHVDAPRVDLSGVEKVLKNDVPAAFAQAIANIPAPEATDLSSLNDALAAIQEQLASIDVGTRMKPQAPNTVKVTDPTGNPVAGGKLLTKAYDQLTVTYTDSTKGTISTIVSKLGGVAQQTVTNTSGATTDDYVVT